MCRMPSCVSILFVVVVLSFFGCDNPNSTSDKKEIDLYSAMEIALRNVRGEFENEELVVFSVEVAEKPMKWEFFFEWEPSGPGNHARVLVTKTDGEVEYIGGM